MTTANDNLRGDRILFSVVMHLRAECDKLRAAYKYDDASVIWKAIHEELYTTLMQVRSEVLNVPRSSMTAADVPSCFPGFH
jgi:hypothetical protein